MLNREEIAACIREHKLIEGLIDLDTQLTPNGFDLTVASVAAFEGQGAVDFSNKERILPQGKELTPKKEAPQDTYGWWQLSPGTYKLKTNETVTLPKALVALAFSRTTLLRMGAFTVHGVWDAGFSGRGEFVLVVANPRGIRLKQNARVAQLVFLRIEETARGYTGMYQQLT